MWRVIVAGLVTLAVLYGQHERARPSFDVASIKPDNILQTSFDIVPRRSGNRITMHNTQLAMVIAYAYGIANPSWQVTNVRLPDGWNFYDIEAIVGNPAVSEDELRQMFQTLLDDRFK